jgi:hypothetical protein
LDTGLFKSFGAAEGKMKGKAEMLGERMESLGLGFSLKPDLLMKLEALRLDSLPFPSTGKNKLNSVT